MAVVMAVVMIVGSLLWLGKTGQWLTVQDIKLECEDNNGLEGYLSSHAPFSPQEICYRLNKQLRFYYGKPLYALDIEKMSSDLARDPWVNKVEMQRIFPDQLLIQVVAKKMVATMIAESGKMIPIDDQGRLLPKVEALDMLGVVQLDSNLKRKESLRKQAAHIVGGLPNSGLFSRKAVSKISYDSKRGFVLELSQPSAQIIIGDDLKFKSHQQLNQVLEYLEVRNIRDRVIDLSFEKKVVVRPRNAD